MKKRLLSFTLVTVLLAIALLFTACSDDSNSDPYARPSDFDGNVRFSHNISARGSGGFDHGVVVWANGDWELSVNADWLTVYPMSGNGDTTLTITIEYNATHNTRNTVIAATSGRHTASCIVSQPPLREIPFTVRDVAFNSGLDRDGSNRFYIDQDGPAWRSVTYPGFERITGYIDVSNVTVYWPRGTDPRGAPMYAYYTRGGFDAGIFTNTRDGTWWGFVGAFTPNGYVWAQSRRAIESDIVFLDVTLRNGNQMYYRLYEVFNHGTEDEYKVNVPIAPSTEPLIINPIGDTGFTQMATIAFHMDNDMELPAMNKNGIYQRGLRFFDTTAHRPDGTTARWESRILDSIHWGATHYSVHNYINHDGDWSNVTVDLIFYNMPQPAAD